MNHPFTPSITDSTRCAECKLNVLTHTDMAVCESCPNIGPVELMGDLALCNECYAKEIKAINDYQSRNLQDTRLAEYKNEELERVKKIDYSVQVRDDIFNAETVSIVEIKEIIDKDDNITNKPYALACMLLERKLHFQKVVFDMNAEQVIIQSKQRSIQTYLNTLASQLREEEREKLRIQNIDYKPSAPKLTVSKPKARKSFDKVELAKYARESGLPLATFQILCIRRNMTPEQMAKEFMRNVNITLADKVTINE